MLRRRYYGGLREDVMTAARQRARALAHQGFQVAEISARLAQPLTRTEQEVLLHVIRAEVRGARRARVGNSLQAVTARGGRIT